MKSLRAAMARFLRGPAVSRWMAGLGIDARQYWLLMDLFDQLSERRDLLSQLGRDDMTLKVISGVYFVLTAIGSILSLMFQPHPTAYFLTFLLLTTLFLFGILIPETTNSIVNPVEGLILAHQPVNGATYTAAKLSHLLRIVFYLVFGINLAPALVALGLKEALWYYPILHLAAVFAAGLIVALSCCAFFGWLMRLVSPARLKSVAQTIELLPWVGLFLAGRAIRVLARLRVSGWLPHGTGPRAALGAAAIISVVAVVVLGIRALSGDYLIRVSAMVHGRSRRARVRTRRPRLADAVARVAGPASRAGFEFVTRMMLRDWHFRRQMILLVPVAMMIVGALASGGLRVNPFSRQLTVVHALPHIAGIALFQICIALPYGAGYNGSWIFLLAPAGAFGGFARGIFARLWLVFIAIPHAVLLCAFAWFWGVPDALLFTAYSAAASSAYLSLELRLIDGVPFTKPPAAAQTAYQMPLMILGGVVVAIAVGVQYFLVFRSRAAVAAATIAIGAAAWAMTRSSLTAFERLMRFHLGLLRAESGEFYKEVS